MSVEKQLEVKTRVGGPKTDALKALRDQYVPVGVGTSSPLFAYSGKGATVIDADGNEFLDFAGGIGVLNVGYSPEEVVNAIKEQVERFIHTCAAVMMYEPYVKLAERVSAVIPGNFAKKAMFVNSGAEAIENAVKIARYATKRDNIIAFEHAFHGRTALTMTLTAKVRPYSFGFGPKASGVYHVPFGYCYRCAFGKERASCDLECVSYIDNMLKTRVPGDTVAAFLMEPVQGEGGFIVPPKEFVQGVKAIAEKHGILFISDEIQSGFGRTAKMFAIEHYGVTPDLTTIAKSLAAGMPLSGVVGRAEIMDAPHSGGLGGTYSGNPVSCAAALAVMDIFEKEDILGYADRVGKTVMARLEEMKKKYPLVGDVRGLGAMDAMELVKDRKTKEPAKEEAGKVVQQCLESGLVILRTGTYDNVIRVLVPLVVSDADLNRGLDILENAVRTVQG